jgi:hypothetical protein
VVCYLEHLNIADELVSLLLMVLLGEKVVVHQASIALLQLHHSYRRLPCRMTGIQGLVETTFGVRRDALQFRLTGNRDATRRNWILGQASNVNHVIDP